ncbi:alpha/beta hydrolase [Oceanicola sp. 22II-s10i]|uniref:alpha/beta fold hydrolase n=1 Tax=Oceanicola sp. 22II-s10i TaxID=1317116 RepID=UPI000B527893|nr:alpha/beta hydrolase [Oceanicola sp. 22II-s10i]OWU85080.1 alpha/beta hydrolase [Oceanicola sp. 22II-s10i]
MRERTVSLNGQDFHIREWGDPSLPPLLMLHGFPEYGGAWEELAGALSHRFRCVAPDQRGYGQSWCPEGVENYTVPELVSDMVALVGDLGGRATLLGHDWGASVAYNLAQRHPELFDRLIILNGVHTGPFRRALAKGGAQTQASQYISWLQREGSDEKLMENDFAKLLVLFGDTMDMAWFTPEKREAYFKEWSRPGRMKAMVNWYRASQLMRDRAGPQPDADPKTDPRRVTIPHLLIWGMGDTALLPEATEGLEDWCDDLTRVEFPDADHWIEHQKPQEVAGTILSWIDR